WTTPAGAASIGLGVAVPSTKEGPRGAWMQRGWCRRAFAAPRNRQWRRVLVVAFVAAAASGCVTGTDPGARLLLPDRTALLGGTTVAFESIDGPPPAVFDRLVATLNTEANAHNLAVVSRNEAATYRV